MELHVYLLLLRILLLLRKAGQVKMAEYTVEYNNKNQLKKLLSTQDKIVKQLKLIEMQIQQTDKRLFKCTIEGSTSFKLHHLRRQSVLEGVAKMLIKAKEVTDKKIEEIHVAQSESEEEESFNRSMDTSLLDNSLHQSDRISHFSLKMDKYVGPETELFSSERCV